MHIANKLLGRQNLNFDQLTPPEQAHERREVNLRNVRRHRSNHTPAEIQETINANSRIEEMVSIPRISEFVEVTDSKAKAFHHILKTRIRHDEQLSHEILDFIQNQAECHYAQCHYAECQFAQCRGASFFPSLKVTKQLVMRPVTLLCS